MGSASKNGTNWLEATIYLGSLDILKVSYTVSKFVNSTSLAFVYKELKLTKFPVKSLFSSSSIFSTIVVVLEAVLFLNQSFF